MTFWLRGASSKYVPKGASRSTLPSSASCRMSAAMKVLVTLAMANWVSSAMGRGGAISALPAVPSQVSPDGSRTAACSPATPSFLTVLRRMASSLRLVRSAMRWPSLATTLAGAIDGVTAGVALAAGVGMRVASRWALPSPACC